MDKEQVIEVISNVFIDRLNNRPFNAKTLHKCRNLDFYNEIYQDIATKVLIEEVGVDLTDYELENDSFFSLDIAKAYIEYLLEVKEQFTNSSTELFTMDEYNCYQKDIDQALYRLCDKFISITGGLRN